MDRQPNTLEVGSSITNFRLPSTGETPWTPNDFVGRPMVLLFYLKDGSEECTRELTGFRDLHGEFQNLGVIVVGIGFESEESHRTFAAANHLPFLLLSDPTVAVFTQYGAVREENVEGQPARSLWRTTYLVTPDARVAGAYTRFDCGNHAAEVLADAKRILLRDEPRRMFSHAPLLLIPNVLPIEFCKTLIELWQTQNEDSGFMKNVDGKTVGMLDYDHKIRRDHFIKPGAIQTRLQTYLANRIVPEIRKAFNYAVTRREDFRIACYDASRGGYFRPHRDNTTDGTAHRRFAMSLLLNDDYEGGFLRFPEYGGHRYRPDAGAAAIFSCSLLHEATDVTAGRRFVLLSFLYGEAEAKAREEYNKRMGGAYRA